MFWLVIALMLAGVSLTLFDRLPLVLLGMLLFTFGFFGAHSVASSWIGRRARQARGQASSLYLFSYYLGSSIAGTLGGVFGTPPAGMASVCSSPAAADRLRRGAAPGAPASAAGAADGTLNSAKRPADAFSFEPVKSQAWYCADSSCTDSMKAPAWAGSTSGVMPWPRLNTWPLP